MRWEKGEEVRGLCKMLRPPAAESCHKAVGFACLPLTPLQQELGKASA